MTPTAVLVTLAQRGASITVERDKLKLLAPKEAITPELRTELVEHKAELLQLLSAPYYICPTCGKPAYRLGGYVCGDGFGRFWCRNDGCLVIWRPVEAA